MLDSAQMYARYVRSLRRFLRAPALDRAACLQSVRTGVEQRELSFLDVLDRAVLSQPSSPYRRLLDHAGVGRGDVERLIADGGLEAALERLYDAGVYVSLEEFRGDRPIVRPGLELPVRPSEFDNPLTRPAWIGRTGGSRSDGRRVRGDFSNFERSVDYEALFRSAHDAWSRPGAVWQPLYPARNGASQALRSLRLGRPIERWFTQTPFGPTLPARAVMTRTVLVASRIWAERLPTPEHVPLGEAVRIARWLDAKTRQGSPAYLHTPVGSAVRVALAARDHGLDVEGTLFRVGGEPLTSTRAAAVAAAGASIVCNYTMVEAGRVGVGCAAPAAADDVHLMTDRLAVIQRPRTVPGSGEVVQALHLTSVLPTTSKLLLNTETDDYAVVEDRRCGCLMDGLGLTRHLHGIRSWEKLTSEGMSFLGRDVVELLEKTLPARFGGSPTDYQLVDERDGVLPAVAVVVSPRVGPLDEEAVVEAVVRGLGSGGPGHELMAGIWRDGRTLRVERREPYQTRRAKILPVHVRR